MSNLADKADRHALYEQAVQCVEAEIDMVDASFETIRGYTAQTLREDFCGTAQTSVEWIQRRPDNIAIGVRSMAKAITPPAEMLSMPKREHRLSR